MLECRGILLIQCRKAYASWGLVSVVDLQGEMLLILCGGCMCKTNQSPYGIELEVEYTEDIRSRLSYNIIRLGSWWF